MIPGKVYIVGLMPAVFVLYGALNVCEGISGTDADIRKKEQNISSNKERTIIMKKRIDFSQCIVRNGSIISCTDRKVNIVFERSGGGISLEGAEKTDKRYISGFITILEEHSLPLTVRFFVHGREEEKAYIRFVLLPGIRTRVCFDLNWLDMAKGGLYRTPGTLKQVIHGKRVDIREVEKVELGVKEVFHDVKLCFEDFELLDSMPEQFPLPETKVVDEFGQYTKKEWPGKIHNLNELYQAVLGNEGQTSYPFENWNRWGGPMSRKSTT